MSLEVERLLDLAAQVPPEKRDIFLAGHCPDPMVRAEVAALLRYADEAESRFQDAIQGGAVPPRSGREPACGDRIGNYRIVSLIGRGGMGCVYLAERADGEIRQQVAIKLLRADGSRPEWRERFVNERQLLASLNHPSIVRVLDAGQTTDGSPYFVMEHVEGVPIDRYADAIGVRARLKLFVRVCEGVSHAHRQLIIHRDLKPSNILVNAAGEPKLLDFGVARLLSDGDVTRSAEQLMTPAYASPEQLRGGPQSTATDVYSLGALLYRLAAGLRLGDARTPAPSRANPEVPRDVDFIVGKALREEPEHRYGSVDELASDVRAVLNWRPVQARGGNLWYRTRRGFRRHWIPLSAALLVVTILSAGLLVANRERAIAERRFRDVRQLANKLFDIEYEIRKISGSTKVSQLIVDTSLDYLGRLAADLHGDPSLALELGNAYLRVARVQGVPTARNLGQMDQAERTLDIAEKWTQSVLAAQPANRAALFRMAQIDHDRMLLARYGGRYDQALTLARQSAEWAEQFHPGAGDKAEASPILSIYLNVADQNARREQFEEALRFCRLGLNFAATAERPDYVPDFLWISADVRRRRGDLDQALKDLDDSVRMSEPAAGQTEIWRTMNYALSLICRGDLLGEENAISLGRHEEALKSLERAFRLGDGLAHRDTSDQMSRSRVANAGISMAGILRRYDPSRALEIYDHTFRHLAEIKDNSSFRRFEVTVLAGSSYALRKLGRPREARQRLDAAFRRLSLLKLYPSEQIALGSEVEDSLRALGEYEAGVDNLPAAIAIFQKLINFVEAGKSSPETSLTDAVRMSTIYRTAGAIHRRAGLADSVDMLERRDRDLWQQWSRRLPDNAFVRRHLTAVRTH